MRGIQTSLLQVKQEVKLEQVVIVMQLFEPQNYLQMAQMAFLNTKVSKDSSKRDNNTIIKPIFTKFKKLIRGYRDIWQFFEYRAYKENKVSFVDFEKLFSYTQIKGYFKELRMILNTEYQLIMKPRSSYSLSRKCAYQEYVDRIFKAMNLSSTHVDRMTMLYANRRHTLQLEQIEAFRLELLTQSVRSAIK